jgi:hypothetical protein
MMRPHRDFEQLAIRLAAKIRLGENFVFAFGMVGGGHLIGELFF